MSNFGNEFIKSVIDLYPDVKIFVVGVKFTSGKTRGYHFTRGNILFSVQFDPGNYCEIRHRKDVDIFDHNDGIDYTTSENAEIAAWYVPSNQDIDLNPGESSSPVKGYVSPEDCLLTMIDIFGN